MYKEDYIDQYVLGEMEAQEARAFEQELEQDAELNRMFLLTRDISAALNEREVLKLRDQLDRIHEDVVVKQKPAIFTLRPLLRIASVIIGLLAVSTVVLLNRGMSDAEIYNQYFEPYHSTVRVRSTVTVDNPLTKAMNFYDAGNFEKAALLFEQILAKDPDKAALNLYSGISHMEIEAYQKANHSFRKIIDSENNPYMEQAEWYLGFCYLMTGEKEKALEQFETIAQSDSFYKDKARKLTRKIKHMKNQP